MVENCVQNIYKNWQTEEVLLGTATLKTKIRDGDTFIIEDSYYDDFFDKGKLKIPENLTPVYSYERWRVQFITVSDIGATYIREGDTKDVNIRYLHNIGLHSSIAREDEEKARERYLEDKFIVVNGIEVF